jgi:hypothetical protein
MERERTQIRARRQLDETQRDAARPKIAH